MGSDYQLYRFVRGVKVPTMKLGCAGEGEEYCDSFGQPQYSVGVVKGLTLKLGAVDEGTEPLKLDAADEGEEPFPCKRDVVHRFKDVPAFSLHTEPSESIRRMRAFSNAVTSPVESSISTP